MDHFQDLDFMINGDTQLTLSPYGYLKTTEEEKDMLCFTAIEAIPESVDSMDMYLLGDTFLRHFYTIFNYDLTSFSSPPIRKIGLAMNSQYIRDGYTNIHAKINFFGDVRADIKHFYIFQSLIIFLTLFIYAGLHLLQKDRMRKRVALGGLMNRAKDGFNGD